MSLRGNNFHMRVLHGLALETKATGTGGTTTGATIVEPWHKGREISFLLVGGDHGAAATATCVVQGRRRDNASWEALKNKAGTDLQFTASKLADGGALEDGTLLGTVPLENVDNETYDAMRLLYTRGAQAVDTLVGAAYIISDLYTCPSSQHTADDLYGQLRN